MKFAFLYKELIYICFPHASKSDVASKLKIFFSDYLLKAITADKTGGENFKHAFLQLHRSASFEEIVCPIYCKAGKHLIYKQAEKKSMGENKILPHLMATERQLYLLPSGFTFFTWFSFVYLSSLVLRG